MPTPWAAGCSTGPRPPLSLERLAQRRDRSVDFSTLDRSRKQPREALRRGHTAPDERLDDLTELGRMGGRYEHPASPRTLLRGHPLPGFGCGRGMRTPDLPI